MFRLIKAGILLAALGVPLAACDTTDDAANAAAAQAQVTAIAKQAQTIAVAACGYVAPISEVAQIVTTFTGGAALVPVAQEIAASICNAVTAMSARKGGSHVPTVHGVKLHGRFIKELRRPA